MNILFIDQFSDPGGAQLCLMDLMPEIKRRGWNPRIMAPGNGELLQWSRREGIPTHPLPLNPYSNGRKTALDFLRFSIDAPRMAITVRQIVDDHDIDLIYVNGPRALPAAMGVTRPVVFHAHSHVSAVYGRKSLAWMLRRTGASVIAASMFVARAHAKLPGEKRVRVIRNGVADLYRGSRSFRTRPVRIGIIGRIAPEKGQLDFVRAARRIVEDNGHAKFFVYGTRLFSDAAYDRAVRTMARNAPVEFCGWTDAVADKLRDLDILAVPSAAQEAAPRVVLEAFSAGTPVVAYRSGGIPEMVENDRTGVLTESPDFESLARGIRNLMDDPCRMERLSTAARSEWERRFKVEMFRTNVCDVLESHAVKSR
jgi:glycosyltransferase involved in cell wall biosynthesis